MTVYSCAHQWDAMLTCIYYAWTSKLGHENIQLVFEPVDQMSLFNNYIHVDSEPDKAEKVMIAVKNKISPFFYNEISYISMAYEDDVMEIIYHLMMLGFKYGNHALKMYQYRDVARYQEIRKRIGNEVCRFKEILRFHQVSKELYVAHIEPKSQLVMAMGPVFADRMPSENWIVVDDIHREAVIHPKDEMFYIKQLNDLEYKNLLETEEANDNFTDLWKVFFETIAIKERHNTRCQNNLFPLWTRKHAVEFW